MISVIYDYIKTHARWKILRLSRDETPLRRPKILLFDQVSELVKALEADYPDETIVASRRDLCQEGMHDLRTATFRYWSFDNSLVYVRCDCGNARQVSAAQWLAAHPSVPASVLAEE